MNTHTPTHTLVCGFNGICHYAISDLCVSRIQPFMPKTIHLVMGLHTHPPTHTVHACSHCPNTYRCAQSCAHFKDYAFPRRRPTHGTAWRQGYIVSKIYSVCTFWPSHSFMFSVNVFCVLEQLENNMGKWTLSQLQITDPMMLFNLCSKSPLCRSSYVLDIHGELGSNNVLKK